MTKLRFKLGDLTDAPFVGCELKIPVYLVDEHTEKLMTAGKDYISAHGNSVRLAVRVEFVSEPGSSSMTTSARACPDSFFDVSIILREY
jgi:hypothetical protein